MKKRQIMPIMELECLKEEDNASILEEERINSIRKSSTSMTKNVDVGYQTLIQGEQFHFFAQKLYIPMIINFSPDLRIFYLRNNNVGFSLQYFTDKGKVIKKGKLKRISEITTGFHISIAKHKLHAHKLPNMHGLFFFFSQKQLIQFGHGNINTRNMWLELLQSVRSEYNNWKSCENSFELFLRNRELCIKLVINHDILMEQNNQTKKEKENLKGSLHEHNSQFEKSLKRMTTKHESLMTDYYSINEVREQLNIDLIEKNAKLSYLESESSKQKRNMNKYKIKLETLKIENRSLNINIRELLQASTTNLLKSPDNSQMVGSLDESSTQEGITQNKSRRESPRPIIHIGSPDTTPLGSVFSPNEGFAAEFDTFNEAKNIVKNMSEYMQICLKRNNELSDKLGKHKKHEEILKKDIILLKEELRAKDADLAYHIRSSKPHELLKKSQRLKFFYKSFYYLKPADLLVLRKVSKIFYNKSTLLLLDINFWKAQKEGFDFPHHSHWILFISWQFESDSRFVEFYKTQESKELTEIPSTTAKECEPIELFVKKKDEENKIIDSEKNDNNMDKQKLESKSTMREVPDEPLANSPLELINPTINNTADEQEHKQIPNFTLFQSPGIDNYGNEGSPNKARESNFKPSFFDANASFLANGEGLSFADNKSNSSENISLLDYSLMNAETPCFEPKNVLCAEFLREDRSPYNYKYLELIEDIVVDSRKFFNFSCNREGFNNVLCFLCVAMKRERRDINRMLNVLLEEPYFLRRLYSPDFYLLNLVIFQIDYLMKQKIPDLHCYFRVHNLALQDIIINWILTIYTLQVLEIPRQTLFKIWDIFLLHGWKGVIAITLSILFLSKDYLESMEYEEILGYFQSGMRPECMDAERILTIFSSFMADDDTLNEIENLFKTSTITTTAM